jgi:DNA (cytosine-5)-methyltransferase 1
MKNNYKIIDLFAGIGGIRRGFELAGKNLGIEIDCVFSSEIDKYACQTYRKNYPNDNHDPFNDITVQNEAEIPHFDILLAGFPCQAFSIAGRRGGFEDTRGTLFFDIARIIKYHNPKAFLLENVKGLVNHRSGQTLKTIINVLKEELGYIFTQFKIINAKNFGVPQNRERIYIVGFKNCGGGFIYPEEKDNSVCIGDIIEENEVSVKYYMSNVYLESMRRHRARHEAKGHGFGYEIKDYKDIANAIVVGGMGKERNLVIDNRLTDFTPITHIKGTVNREGVRRMTPVEWERLQGFPDNWTDSVADGNRYKQLGNSVAVPVITSIAAEVLKELTNPSPFIEKLPDQIELKL